MRKDPQNSRQLDTLIQSMEQSHGLDVSAYEGTFLRQTIDRRRAEMGGLTVEAYCECLAGSRAEAEAFYRSLRVGYSEFFRDPLTFALLEQQILPALIAENREAERTELRVWSAGCAAGQEAWSVAILLDGLCGSGHAMLPYRIFATDVSEADLTCARNGIYNDDSVGNIRLKHLQTCFSHHADTYAIVPRLRARVDFSHYDLLDEHSVCPPVSLYGDFDLIFCCNLLFYYRPELRQRILDKFCSALAPGGYFVTGETEKGFVSEHQWLCAVTPSGTVFKKR
ncbi:MAG: protein-glutamate O-methyltransferase CheR [bacterium]